MQKRYGAAVARSTKRFLSARREMNKCALTNLTAMGRELIAVKKKLAHGKWQTWVREDLRMAKATAARIIDVAQASESKVSALILFESMDTIRLYRQARQ